MRPDQNANDRLESEQRIALRLAARPKISYDERLPIATRRAAIAGAIRRHPVVIVCGETGSGKTTQLPKICLELGFGVRGLIGHTQPRRIAARATAARISQEVGSELGCAVGYKIRFGDRVSANSYIKLMTDGILLAETQGDPLLRQYDVIIVDEAHERSINIDFLLGHLKQVLQSGKRRELKVIVTSATLDAQRFSKHFDGAPVLEVSGRMYPIEIKYRPLIGSAVAVGGNGLSPGALPGKTRSERDLNDAIVDAVSEAHAIGPGDVLVFLPGEREIREAAERLRKHAFSGRGQSGQGIEILSLFARQSATEQARIFQPHEGRRIVLATNVAETSLTVPGIRYVVDTGLARIKRYSQRTKVEQLQIESISQASANQRAGRCGRVAGGICFRLYGEDDYARRSPYGEPEILRSSLAGVILRMKSLNLGSVEEFPFLQAPASRMIADGHQLLVELGAIDSEGKHDLTELGRELAMLPLDPKIGRMILAARHRGALREVLVIAAALSINDPRERPEAAQAAADQVHAKWQNEHSEFLIYTKLWQAAEAVWLHESAAKQKLWCRKNFVSWSRMREWRDVHSQLHALCAEHGWCENRVPASFAAIHQALLAGLLGNVGVKTDTENRERFYFGAHGVKFLVHPSSALVKKPGRWLMAAELVDSGRLYARCIGQIEPEWLEDVGRHLVRRHVYEPHWEKRAGRVMAWERATLHGLVLYAKRRVAFGDDDPTQAKLARELFIRAALVDCDVEEDYIRRTSFFRHNRQLIADIEKLEHKSRRPDVLVDPELIFAFYDACIPDGVASMTAFDVWRKKAEVENTRLLFLEREQLMRHEAAGITTEAFPHRMCIHGQNFELSYHHDPGAVDDGATLALPLGYLNQISANRCEWLVPGLLEEKVRGLLKTLPQKIRHRVAPIDDFARSFCAVAHDQEEPLVHVLTRVMEEKLTQKLPLDAFRAGDLPAHLRLNFRLEDAYGGTLAMSRSLAELQAKFGGRVEQSFAGAEIGGGPANIVASGLTTWTFGDLPVQMEVTVCGRSIQGFPAVIDEGGSVALRIFDTPEKAASAHRTGMRRLFMLALPEQLKYARKNLGVGDVTLQSRGLFATGELEDQLLAVTIERTCMIAPLPKTSAEFAVRVAAARARIALVAQELSRLAREIVSEYALLQRKLVAAKAFPAAASDISLQCEVLLEKGFMLATPVERLQHFPRYLKAAAMRLDKLRNDSSRDARLMADWHGLAEPYRRSRIMRERAGVVDAFMDDFRWLLEELRVALFAQELRTPTPVSVKRLHKTWQAHVNRHG